MNYVVEKDLIFDIPFFGVYPLHTGPVQTAQMMYASFLLLLFHVLFYINASTRKYTYDHIRMHQYIYM